MCESLVNFFHVSGTVIYSLNLIYCSLKSKLNNFCFIFQGRKRRTYRDYSYEDEKRIREENRSKLKCDREERARRRSRNRNDQYYQMDIEKACDISKVVI